MGDRIYRTERTGIHRFVERRLDELGVAYESEVSDFEPYRLDIYISEAYAYIEVDGHGHTRSRDEKRDKFLEDTYKLRGMHLKYSTHRDMWSAEVIKDKLLQFLEQVWPTAEQRRQEYIERLQHQPVELYRESGERRRPRLRRRALKES